MKIWINFDEKEIKKRKEGWREGNDWNGQLIYEREQDIDNCYLEFNNEMVTLHFDNGFIEIPKSELGGLF
jgi:hypothetical protein